MNALPARDLAQLGLAHGEVKEKKEAEVAHYSERVPLRRLWHR